MQNVSVFRLTRAALMMALTTIATMILQVPIPAAGYVNLGDCFVLLCGIFLGPVYGGLAAGLGAGLADLLSGFVIYAPATFIIKGACAAVMALFTTRNRKEKNMVLPALFSGIISELGMALGYFLYEGFVVLRGTEGFRTSFSAAAAGIPFNLIQGAVGIALMLCLYPVLRRFVQTC